MTEITTKNNIYPNYCTPPSNIFIFLPLKNSFLPFLQPINSVNPGDEQPTNGSDHTPPGGLLRGIFWQIQLIDTGIGLGVVVVPVVQSPKC